MKIIDTKNKRDTEIIRAGTEAERKGRLLNWLYEKEENVLADSNDVYFVKASFTVEGSFVIGICLLVICSLILLGYDVFNQALGFVDTVKCRDYDGIRTFRLIAAGRNFTDALKGGG